MMMRLFVLGCALLVVGCRPDRTETEPTLTERFDAFEEVQGEVNRRHESQISGLSGQVSTIDTRTREMNDSLQRIQGMLEEPRRVTTAP
jgi:hypothetical protein